MARPTSITLGVSFDFTKANQQLSQAVQNAQNTFNRVSFVNPLGRITKDTKDFESSLQAASQRVIAFSASLGTLAATASILRAIVKDTIAVEAAFTDINSVFQLSSKNLADFSKDLFDVARQTSSSFEIATEAAKEFSRQGLDSAETLKRVRDALILTRTSGLDVNKSVETLTATINGFNNASVDSTRIINKLVAVDQNFAVSSRDLAEALSRVGSTAQDAGVSFDELIGLITAAQQTTARGGAVIGNALKSIFTRIERPQALEQLQDLNIQVTDLQGNALPAIKVLQNLAGSFDTLSDAAKSQATQLVGGVFQINILRSVLKDLGKEQGIAAQATRTSGGAYDEAIKRNEALNHSLQSLVTQTQLTGKQINSIIGQITFADKFKDILGIGNNNPLTESFKNINTSDTGLNYGKDVGANVAEGILAGIGNTLSGPALFYISKILIGVAKSTFKVFGGDLIQLAGVNNQSGQQKDLTNEINQLYAVGNSHLKDQLTTATALTNQMGILKDTLGGGIASGLKRNANSIPIVPTTTQQRVILPNYGSNGFPNPTVTTGAPLTQQEYQAAFTQFIQGKGKLQQIPLGAPPMTGGDANSLLFQQGGIKNMPMRNAQGQFAKLGTSPSTQSLLNSVGGQSFDDVFIGAIRREISESGRSLAAAIDLVKLNFQKLGASADQIDTSLKANASGLTAYDSRLGTNRYVGDQNFRLNQANKTLSSGGTLAYNSPAFKAVIQQAGMDFSDSYYQRIGKTFGVDELTPLENRKLNLGVNIARSRAKQRLTSTDVSGFLRSRSATDVTEYLQSKTASAFDGSFGFFSGLLGQNEGIASDFISQRKITGNQARAYKAAAMQKQLASRQQAAFAGSLLLPFAAGFIPNGTSGEASGIGSGAASGALNAGGLGLAVGGLPGLAIGGILGGAYGAINRINKSFEELAKDLEESNAKNIALLDAANNFSRLDESIRSTAASGGSPREIKTLIGQQREVFASITDPNIRRKLIAAQGNPDALESVRSDLSAKNGFEGAANDISTVLGRSNTSFSRFFGNTSLNTKDFGSLASTIQIALQRGEDKTKGFASSVLNTAKTNPTAALKALGVDDTLGATTKDLSDAFLAAKQGMVDLGDETRRTAERQGNFRRELDKLAQQLEFASQFNQRENTGQNEISRLSNEGAISLLGGSAETTQRLQGFSQLQSVQNLGQINLEGGLGSVKAKLIRDAADNELQSITPAINAAGSIGGIQGLSGLVGQNSKMLLAIQEAVQQLESIDQNTRLETQRTQVQIEISRLQLISSQRNRILDNARYSPTTTQSFRDASIASRSQFGANPAASRANAVLDQLNILNSLGVPESDEIIQLKRAAQKVSAKAALSSLGSSNDAIGNALSAAIGSLDSTSQVTPAGLRSSALPGLGGGKLINGESYGQSTFSKIIANLNASVQGKELSKAAAAAAQSQASTVISNENLRLAPITALQQAAYGSRRIAQRNDIKDNFDNRFQGSIENYLGKTIKPVLRANSAGEGAISFSETTNPIVEKISALFTDALHSNSIDKLLSTTSNPSSQLSELGRKANLDPSDFEDLLNKMVVAIAGQLAGNLVKRAAENIDKKTKTANIPALLDKNTTGGSGNSYLAYMPKILQGFDPFALSLTDYAKQQKTNAGLTLPKFTPATLPTIVSKAETKEANRQDLFTRLANSKISLVDNKELGNLNGVIDDLNTIYDLKLKIINLEGGNPKDSFLQGFTHQFDILQAKMQDLSDVGAQVGQSLESNLSGAFGNFVTGAQKGKDAFRSFVVGVLNDSAKAFASKAVQQLLGTFLNSGALGTIDTSKGSGLSPAPISFAGKATGGVATQAPALLTGGEFVVPKSQASTIGYDTLYKMNSGSMSRSSIGYASGGLVHGGSGTHDDVVAMLNPGDFVMKKSAVNQYGSENLLRMVQAGRMQKRDLGGLIIGALFGGAIGGITGGKKGAIVGALGGGLLGGLSGSSGAASTFNKLPISLKLALGAGLLGVASSAMTPKAASTDNTLPSLTLGQAEALRKTTEAENNTAQSKGSGFLMPVQTKDGFLIYERQQVAATRRFASGGTVPSMLMGGEAVIPASIVNSVGASRFSNGGFAGSPSMNMNSSGGGNSIGGDVNINVTVNKDGSVANPGGVDDQTHGNMLSRQIKSAVLDILANQTRQGGIMYQAYGTSRLAS